MERLKIQDFPHRLELQYLGMFYFPSVIFLGSPLHLPSLCWPPPLLTAPFLLVKYLYIICYKVLIKKKFVCSPHYQFEGQIYLYFL